jgi:hypothetical protein
VRAVRIGQLAGDEDPLRLEVAHQLEHDRHVLRTDGPLADLAGLVERQVQEVSMVGRNVHRPAGGHRFGPADERL